MAELVVVANRGPSVHLAPDGSIEVSGGAGGVTPSLYRALEGRGATYVAAATTNDERLAARSPEALGAAGGVGLRLVEIDAATYRAAYDVIASGTLWFTYHGLYDHARRPLIDRHWHDAWECYRAYNAALAAAVSDASDEGATVVVNDYHLALTGTLLRRARPDLHTVHFAHTPFAWPDELLVLPDAERSELLDGLSSFGAIGFHIGRWADAYRASAGPGPDVFTAPLGVDAPALLESAAAPAVRAARDELTERVGARQLIARNDRVELSKNLVRGFLAFGELLETEPRRRGAVQFVARAYLSRTGLAEYLAYANEVLRAVERVNERFGTADYTPIVLEVADDRDAATALLCAADVTLVNPVRDGMNLVAKEGAVVNENDGVLCLSRGAGAFDELGEEAVAVDAFDISGTATALARALDMEAGERRARAGAMREIAGRLPPAKWLDLVIAHARRPTR